MKISVAQSKNFQSKLVKFWKLRTEHDPWFYVSAHSKSKAAYEILQKLLWFVTVGRCCKSIVYTE